MLTATVLALISAFLHAGWNFLVKTGDERDLVAWGQFTFGAVLACRSWWSSACRVSRRSRTWLASPAVHVVYLLALLRSYHHGDFSLAYPLARGSGALLAAIGGVALLDDHLGGWSWVAIGIVILGVVLLVGPEGPRTDHRLGAPHWGDHRYVHA